MRLKIKKTTPFQNLWDTVKALFISFKAYIDKMEEYSVSDLNFHYKKLKKEQIKIKASKFTKIRTKIKEKIEINKIQSWFLERSTKEIN